MLLGTEGAKPDSPVARTVGIRGTVMEEKDSSVATEDYSEASRRMCLIASVVFCLSAALMPVWIGVSAVMHIDARPFLVLLCVVCGSSGLLALVISNARRRRQARKGTIPFHESTPSPRRRISPAAIAEFDARLLRLAERVAGMLPTRDIDEFVSLVEAGEPQIAVESLCTQLDEYERTLDTSTLEEVVAVGRRLDLDPKYWERLRSDV